MRLSKQAGDTLKALISLAQHAGAGMAELASHCDVPADQLQPVLDQLEDAGIVERQGHAFSLMCSPAKLTLLDVVEISQHRDDVEPEEILPLGVQQTLSSHLYQLGEEVRRQLGEVSLTDFLVPAATR